MKKLIQIIVVTLAAVFLVGCNSNTGSIPANKKEIMDAFVAGTLDPSYVPAAFFIHFPGDAKLGEKAVKCHLEYYIKENPDILKVQFEQSLSSLGDIKDPATWESIAPVPEDFYRPTVETIRSILEVAGKDVYVLPTVYSPFQASTHALGEAGLREGALNHPEEFKKLLGYCTDALIWFVDECKKMGIEGFYMCCQGGEKKFEDIPDFHAEFVKPYDLKLFNECVDGTKMNILHICDWEGTYADLTKYVDYPGQIVNTPIDLDGTVFTVNDGVKMFGRPVLGGLERKGTIISGTPEEVAEAARKAIAEGPAGKMMLGAECTVSSATIENIQAAVSTAHHGGR